MSCTACPECGAPIAYCFCFWCHTCTSSDHECGCLEVTQTQESSTGRQTQTIRGVGLGPVVATQTQNGNRITQTQRVGDIVQTQTQTIGGEQ